MNKIDRISISGIENLVEDKEKLAFLGKGKVIPTMDSGLKLKTYKETIEKLNYMTYYLGEGKTDNFMRMVNNFLKENKFYVANAYIRDRNWVDGNKFACQKLTGIFYKEKQEAKI